MLLVDEVEIPGREGTLLAADVWRPADHVPHPVVLLRTPYSRDQARLAHDALGWARRGWAVVHQDVRGRFGSAGAFDPFRQETEDGTATLDWLVEQPWCDGSVVMVGPSYVGATQWLAASGGHAALRAVAPTTSMHDLSRWNHEGGTPRRGFLAWWAAGFAAALSPLALGMLEELLSDHPGSDLDERLSALYPDYATWSSSGVPVEVDLAPAARPAHHVVGWHDLFCEDSLASYRELVEALGPKTQRLVVGPWTHVGVGLQTAGDVDYGPAATALVAEVWAEQEAFLRAVVEGREAVWGVRVFVMGENAWRDLPSWPPPSTEQVLQLDHEGLVPPGPGLVRKCVLTHDPAAPVPSLGGRTLGPDLLDAGPRDHRPLASREDVLHLVSDPLDAPLTVIGEVALELPVSSDGEHDLVVRLLDVHVDGRALSVVEHSHRLPASRDPATRRVIVGSTAQRFEAGHRIGLQVALSSWPRLGTTPPATVGLHLGEGSVLVLPAM